jgi:ribose transport system permease protein
MRLARRTDALDSLNTTSPVESSPDNALPHQENEPPHDSGSTQTASRVSDRVRRIFSHYFLVVGWVALGALYTLLLPDRFLQFTTAQSVFGSQSPLLFLALAALCTLVVGEFDLSVAGVMGFSATIIPVLATLHHWSLGLACAVAILASVLCGGINAFFIVGLGVPALSVTLGTASLYLGLSELVSQSNTVSVTSTAFYKVTSTNLLGLPLMFYYGVAAVLALAYFFSWTAPGRHVAFVGANREVARLAGIRVNRIRALSYVVASLLAGLAGLLLVGSVGGVDPTTAGTYLLPALASVFLGASVVIPGQFNPIGTLIGIYFLETGIIGLEILGASGWVDDAFYGAGLVTAVTLASLVARRARTA